MSHKQSFCMRLGKAGQLFGASGCNTRLSFQSQPLLLHETGEKTAPVKATHEPLRSPPQRAIQRAATLELAQRAAALWGAKGEGPKPVRAVQNYVFAIERAGRPAILRLTHESHRSVEEVEAELRWILDLKECGLPMAAPYRSRGDRRTETVLSAQGGFVVSCFEHLAGTEPDPKNPELWTDRMFEKLGALTAKMHQASYDAAWTPATLPRRTWREGKCRAEFPLLRPGQ